MKHIKFEENISADVSYKRDKAPKKEYVQKAPENENDEYDIPETKKWHQEVFTVFNFHGFCCSNIKSLYYLYYIYVYDISTCLPMLLIWVI